MSVQRSYASPNYMNFEQIRPIFGGILPQTSISGCSVYYLNIPKVGSTQYFVDLNGLDQSGNLLNVNGLFYPLVPDGNNYQPINIVSFIINIDISAPHIPGSEFTIFFKNMPFERLTGVPLLTLGIISSSYEEGGPPFPYIVSPPYPSIIGENISQSLTFKSDGTQFNIVGSGPAGWLGVPALSVILRAYDGFD